MYTIPPLTESPREAPAKAPHDKTAMMAQRLYDHFSNLQLNVHQWLECLERFLADSSDVFRKKSSRTEIRNKIRNIITHDKSIPVDQISEEAQQAVYREVAEWLTAEKIVEKMIAYEDSIQEGIKMGSLKPFHEIEEVLVLKDGEYVSHEQLEDIKKFIKDNYVLDVGKAPLGQGARVVVRELKPKNFPLPYPKKDELRDGLMLKIPNHFLVLRLTKSTYKTALGNEINKSEENAIEVFKTASELLVFSGSESVMDLTADTANKVLDVFDDFKSANPVKKPRKTRQYSFVPPLIIIKAVIEPGRPAEYMTIQKKIQKKGVLMGDEHNFVEDLRQIHGFRSKVKKFLTACKRLYGKSKRLPDTVGYGNILYTEKGNIYLVDINNITPEPDYYLIALICLYHKIITYVQFQQLEQSRLKSLESELPLLRKEIFEEMRKHNKFDCFANDSDLDQLIDNMFINNKHPKVRSFFRTTGLIDDLDLPIFMHNVQNLYNIEKNIYESELKDGKISKEEFEKRLEAIYEEPIYRMYFYRRAPWKNKHSFNLEDILDNKKAGFDNWQAMMVGELYNFIANSGANI